MTCVWRVFDKCLTCVWHVFDMCMTCVWHVYDMCVPWMVVRFGRFQWSWSMTEVVIEAVLQHGLDHHFPVALQLLRSKPKHTTKLCDGLDHDFPVMLQLHWNPPKCTTILPHAHHGGLCAMSYTCRTHVIYPVALDKPQPQLTKITYHFCRMFWLTKFGWPGNQGLSLRVASMSTCWVNAPLCLNAYRLTDAWGWMTDGPSNH